MDELDELEPELRALLEAERDAPLPGMAAAKARGLAAVLDEVGAPSTDADAAPSANGEPPGVGEAGVKAAMPAKAVVAKTLVATAILSGALGVGVTWAVMRGSPVRDRVDVRAPRVELPERAPAGLPTSEASAAPSETPPPDLVEEEPVTRGTPTGMTTPEGVRVERGMEEASAATRGPSRLARERALIDQARAALRADRAHDALVALMGHAREFPAGALAEDRERLAVESLIRTDRRAAARRRAEAFLARYPDSAHRPRIQRFLDELPDPP